MRAGVGVRTLGLVRSIGHNGTKILMNRSGRLESACHPHAHQARTRPVRRCAPNRGTLPDRRATERNSQGDCRQPAQIQQTAPRKGYCRSQPAWALLRSRPTAATCARARRGARVHAYSYGGTREKEVGDTHLKKLFRRRRLPPTCGCLAHSGLRGRIGADGRAPYIPHPPVSPRWTTKFQMCAETLASRVHRVHPHSRDGGDAGGGGKQARSGRGFRWRRRASYSGRLPGGVRRVNESVGMRGILGSARFTSHTLKKKYILLTL